MPCLRVFTNVDADKSAQNAFLKEASSMVAKELRKPESYVTVSCIANQAILWGGVDIPCAQIYLMSLGGLNENVNSNISKKLAALLKKHFHIESDHYYIHFIEAEGYMIGYDGATFYPFLLETNKGNATHSLLGYFKGLETRNSLRLIL